MSDRLERAIQILVLLQSRIPHNTLQLAQELGVHRRTIFRDIAALRAVGIPILVDAESGCYSLLNASPVPLETISNDELTELLIAASTTVFSTSSGGNTARRATLKLLRRLPKDQREEVARVIRAASPAGTNAAQSVRSQTADAVLLGIRRRRVLEITADAPHSGSPHVFRFQPQRLSFAANGWSVLGRTYPELQPAELAVATLREVRLTETPFADSRFETRADRVCPESRLPQPNPEHS